MKRDKGHVIQDKKGLSRVDCWEAPFPQISKAFARNFKIEVRILFITFVFMTNNENKH